MNQKITSVVSLLRNDVLFVIASDNEAICMMYQQITSSLRPRNDVLFVIANAVKQSV